MTMRAENYSNDFSVVKVTMCVISAMVHRSDYLENIIFYGVWTGFETLNFVCVCVCVCVLIYLLRLAFSVTVLAVLEVIL